MVTRGTAAGSRGHLQHGLVGCDARTCPHE